MSVCGVYYDSDVQLQPAGCPFFLTQPKLFPSLPGRRRIAHFRNHSFRSLLYYIGVLVVEVVNVHSLLIMRLQIVFVAMLALLKGVADPNISVIFFRFNLSYHDTILQGLTATLYIFVKKFVSHFKHHENLDNMFLILGSRNKWLICSFYRLSYFLQELRRENASGVRGDNRIDRYLSRFHANLKNKEGRRKLIRSWSRTFRDFSFLFVNCHSFLGK